MTPLHKDKAQRKRLGMPVRVRRPVSRWLSGDSVKIGIAQYLALRDSGIKRGAILVVEIRHSLYLNAIDLEGYSE
jgi:hypothetical protein